MASHDLGRVVASEQSIGSLVHLLGSHRERDNGIVDDSVVLQRPEVVQLLLVAVLMRRQAEDAVGLLAETLGLVESQELEVGALILLQLEFEID